MKKVFLSLKNKRMEFFIKNCGIFEISNDTSSNYDILFCDQVENGKNIKAKTKIYLACNIFEGLNDINSYFSGYDYYIGFGKNVYENVIKKISNIDPSKVFDGFVYDAEYESLSSNKNITTLFLPETNYCLFEAMMIGDIQSFLKNITEKNIPSSSFELKKYEKIISIICRKNYSEILNSNDFHIEIEEPTNDLINRSKILFFSSIFNTRIYFNDEIMEKVIISGNAQSIYRKFLDISGTSKSYNGEENEIWRFKKKNPGFGTMAYPSWVNLLEIIPGKKISNFLNDYMINEEQPQFNIKYSDEEIKMIKEIKQNISKDIEFWNIFKNSLGFSKKEGFSLYDAFNSNLHDRAQKLLNNSNNESSCIKDCSEEFRESLVKIANS